MNRSSFVLSASVLCCVVVGLAPVTAAAASGRDSSSVVSAPKKKAKLDADVEKRKVQKGETVKIKGSFKDLARDGRAPIPADEPLIVQQLQAGAWVNVEAGTCRPNGTFSLRVSFSVSASLSLRVFHPETDLYLSATSDVFSLVVL